MASDESDASTTRGAAIETRAVFRCERAVASCSSSCSRVAVLVSVPVVEVVVLVVVTPAMAVSPASEAEPPVAADQAVLPTIAMVGASP
jgi:hypothetical protein